jgi:hypothetical protein
LLFECPPLNRQHDAFRAHTRNGVLLFQRPLSSSAATSAAKSGVELLSSIVRIRFSSTAPSKFLYGSSSAMRPAQLSLVWLAALRHPIKGVKFVARMTRLLAKTWRPLIEVRRLPRICPLVGCELKLLEDPKLQAIKGTTDRMLKFIHGATYCQEIKFRRFMS